MITTTETRATKGKAMALGLLLAALIAASLLAASQALASTTFTVNSIATTPTPSSQSARATRATTWPGRVANRWTNAR